MESVTFIDELGNSSLSGILDPVPWWSFTKTVLAIAALRLVERGLLYLNEPVDGKPFTLAHLLRHESGLPDYGALARYHEDVAAGKAPWPVERLLDEVDATRLRYEPGKGWAYSNIGYLKVAQLLEQAVGIPLRAALEQLVFIPAGLATARLAIVPSDLAGVQMGHSISYHPGWVFHGLVTGTTADAARLIRALAGGFLVRPETFAMMLERRVLPEYRSVTFADPAYGLGLMLNAYSPLDHPVGHRGAGPGSAIAVYALGNKACAIWETSQPNPDLVADRTFKLLQSEK